jgi:NAD+ kinase
LAVEPGHFGFRLEIDGRRTAIEGIGLTIRRRAEYAALVELAEEEPWLTGLRRRGLVLDSPRVLLRDTRKP